MKELYWKVLLHVHGADDWGGIDDRGEVVNPGERGDNIYAAGKTVEQMSTLELLQAIGDVFEKEAA